jgi:hypothetical protein
MKASQHSACCHAWPQGLPARAPPAGAQLLLQLRQALELQSIQALQRSLQQTQWQAEKEYEWLKQGRQARRAR